MMDEINKFNITMAENYTLKWDTYSEHLHLMSKDLYHTGEYSDITLVSDDQTQFKAHKIVLSSCSPVFKKIIDSNPSQHPLIYLRGIQSYEMESILQFMYLGEGKFYQERMGEFIKVAKDLEVKEISKGVEMPVDEEYIIEDDIQDVVINESLQEKNESQDEKPKPTFTRRQISTDTKSSKCPECEAVFKQSCTMLRHYRAKHEGIKYPCSECDYKATQQSDLQTHMRAKHSDTILKCDRCDYQTSWRTNYHAHKKTHDVNLLYKNEPQDKYSLIKDIEV